MSYITIIRLVVPLAIAVFAVASEYSGLDLFLEGLFFDHATQSWPLKSNFITAGVLHKGAQRLVVYFAVGLLLFIALSFLIKKLRPYRKGAGYLLLCILLGTGIVSLLKSTTHIYTPWDLVLFGGDKPYIRLFDAVPPGLPVGHAFPGGHSSGGFAFVSLYFLLTVYRPSRRYYGLAFGLGLGALFAITQELRGAHFLSHDLFSLVICWYVAWGLYHVVFQREKWFSSAENGFPAWKMVFQRGKWFFSVENGFSAWKMVFQRGKWFFSRKNRSAATLFMAHARLIPSK